jgi:hypothetical protein
MVVGGGDGVGDENKCKKYVEKLQRKDTFWKQTTAASVALFVM